MLTDISNYYTRKKNKRTVGSSNTIFFQLR